MFDIFEFKNLIKKVKPYYHEKHRGYHSWSHIKQMFFMANKLNINLSIEQSLAILFHDIVYVPRFKFNEEASKELAFLILKDDCGFPKFDLEKVGDLILSTKENNINKLRNTDAAIIHDLDYSLIGYDYKDFKKMRKGVRFEHSGSSDAEFNAGSLIFINSLLSLDVIYCTPIFVNYHH